MLLTPGLLQDSPVSEPPTYSLRILRVISYEHKRVILSERRRRLTDSNLTHTATFNSAFEDAYFIDLGLLRRLYTFQDYFNIEIEGQIAKHFGNQDHWEFNLVSYFRWLLFPWDSFLDTSFAAGTGLSYATSVPQIEAKNYDDTAKFLGALMFEFTFSLPQVPEWSVVTGIHHRSGAG